MVQGLRHCTSNAGGACLIPGLGTNIPCVSQPKINEVLGYCLSRVSLKIVTLESKNKNQRACSSNDRVVGERIPHGGMTPSHGNYAL